MHTCRETASQRRRLRTAGILMLTVALGALVIVGLHVPRPVRADEEIVFFPTFAHLTPDGQAWVVPIHGWIFEPERDSVVRAGLLDRLRQTLGLRESADEGDIFHERARLFLVDNERGKDIAIEVGGKQYRLPPSEPNGHFQGEIRLSTVDAAPLVKEGWLSFEAVLPKGDPRRFRGAVRMIPQTGLSVISDIDDTIKITEVTDRSALVKNTFCRPFRAVPGMADVYRRWAAEGVCFHYVSASPWQLYPVLSEFMASAGFPSGSFHQRFFRLKDSTALELLESPVEMKREAIGAILAAFPRRQFILVGDSGENDPEIYGTVARAHPEQVVRILIRNVTDEGPDGPRMQAAFEGVPADRWMLFREAEQIEVAATTKPASE